MAEVPQLSVVIATRDRPSLLEGLLDSLRVQTLSPEEFEVVVVDDASSTPETATVLAREQERGQLRLKVIRRERAGGPGAARNDGWRAAQAPLVAFTDDDCVAAPEWLARGLEAAHRQPGSIVQGRTEPEPSEWARFSPFSYTVAVDSPGHTFQTCNIFYPREVLEQVGGFDYSSFTMAGEDTDLAWRAIEQGVEARFEPGALVYHAVHHLGPVGRLKEVGRWHEMVLCFRRHPGLRKHLIHGIFWKRSHYLLARALLALVLPERLRLLRLWLAAPYVTHLTDRRSGPLLAPYAILLDVLEVASVVRGAVRYRTPVL